MTKPQFTLVPYAETELAVMANDRKLTTKELILAGANQYCARTPNLPLHHTHSQFRHADPQP